MLADRGDPVCAGQSLAVLETDLVFREFEIAEHELRLAEAEFDRIRSLHDVVSAHERLRVEIARDQAASNLEYMRGLVDRCMDDLDSYSRLLGRDPTARGTARAFALLPTAIAAANGGEEIARIRKWADEVIESGGIAPSKEAISRWPCANGTWE